MRVATAIRRSRKFDEFIKLLNPLLKQNRRIITLKTKQESMRENRLR